MCKKIIATILCLLMILPIMTVQAAGLKKDAVTLYGFRIYDDVDKRNAFVHFTSDEPSKIEKDKDQSAETGVWAGTYFGGAFYGVDRTGVLFTCDLESFTRNAIGVVLKDTNSWQVSELTYDYENERLILLANNLLTDVRTSVLYGIDPETGAASKLCELQNGVSLRAMAADGDGKLYGIDAKGVLYKIDAQTGACVEVGKTGRVAENIQSMCFDRKNGTLYWANYAGVGNAALCIVDTATAKVQVVDTLAYNAKISGLSVVDEVFRVKFETETGGSAGTNGSVYYDANDRVSLTATCDKDYTFGGWSVSDGTLSSTTEQKCTLVMPAKDVTVKAYFIPKNNKYTERTVRDNDAGVTVFGSSLYYNSTVSVADLADGEAYQQLKAKIKNRDVVKAFDLSLVPHATNTVTANKGSVLVSIHLDATYEGKKMTAWQWVNGKAVAATATVKDGLLTYRTKAVAPVLIVEGGNVTFWSVLLILFLVIIVAFLAFVGYIWYLRQKRLRRMREIQAAKRKKAMQ